MPANTSYLHPHRVVFRGLALIVAQALCLPAVTAVAADAAPSSAVSAATRARMARDEKEMADNFFMQQQLDTAADLYLRALELDDGIFTYAERFAISKRLLAAGRRRETKELLRRLVEEPHKGTVAEVALARLLAADGEYDAAVDEIDRILRHDRKNERALLVKGNVLRWRKSFNESMQVYRNILAQRDDFDARLGLIYSLLAVGRKQEALQHFKLLHAEDEWQQADLAELTGYIQSITRPVAELQTSSFTDNDGDSIGERNFTLSVNVIDWDFSFTDRTRHASIGGLATDADSYRLWAGRNLTDALRLSLTAGKVTLTSGKVFQETQSGGSLTTPQRSVSHALGEIWLTQQLGNGEFQAGLLQDVGTATAILIRNNVTMRQLQLVYSWPLSQNVTAKGIYRGTDYESAGHEVVEKKVDGVEIVSTGVDGGHNYARDFEGSALWAINSSGPRFSLGYGYRSVSFNQPSTAGYFDVQNYQAHKLLLLMAYEKGPLYFYSDFAWGQQSYIRKRYDLSDDIVHAGGTAGINLFKRLRVELNGEINNSASNAIPGYTYKENYSNLRLSYTF